VAKVFSILSIQLICTFSCCLYSLHSPSVFSYLNREHPNMLMVSSIIPAMIIVLSAISPSTLKKVPTNYILLSVFTICESYSLAMTVYTYNVKTVILAILVTMALTISLTIYAMTTKRDITYSMTFLMYSSISLVVVSIVSVFYRTYLTSVLVSLVCGMLLCFYLVWDVQMIVGGRRHSLEIDDYIYASIILY